MIFLITPRVICDIHSSNYNLNRINSKVDCDFYCDILIATSRQGLAPDYLIIALAVHNY